MSETHATIRGDASKITQMLREASLDDEKRSKDETSHSDLYLNILEEEIRILQMAPGEVVLSYCSYGEDFLDSIELEKEVETREGTDKNGNDFEYDTGAEVILDVERALTYLGLATEGGTVELTFTGEEGSRLAEQMTADGALTGWTRLPGSQSALDKVPQWLPRRFSSDEVFTNTAGDEAPTQVRTKSETIQQIIEIVNQNRDADNYPLVVEDGELVVDIGTEQGDGVSGSLSTQEVEGPDVENYYHDGFEEIFATLSGPVHLQTAPGGNPVSVVQSDSDKVVRHVNGPVVDT